MYGIYSKTFQQHSLVPELLPQPCQEAGPSMCTVTSITPTRYMPEAQGDNAFLGDPTQQPAGKSFQEMQPSSIHNDTSGNNQKKTDSTHSTYKVINVNTPLTDERVCVSSVQIKNIKELNREHHNLSEQQRRKIIAELYKKIEHTLRETTPIQNNPSKKNLLLACIKVLKETTHKKDNYPDINLRKRTRNRTKLENSEKRFIKNNYESERRHEIRDLLTNLRNVIPGSAYQKGSERVILENFLSFITETRKLKKSNNQPDKNPPSKKTGKPHKKITSNREVKTDSLNKKTAIGNTSQILKVSVCDYNQIILPGAHTASQNPEEMYSTLNCYQSYWFESVSQILEYEFQCLVKEQCITTDEYPWDEPGMTDNNHSPVTPPPSSPQPGSSGQDNQLQPHCWLPDLTPFDNSVYSTQTDTATLYPADGLPMMQAVSPLAIFQWRPCQQMLHNYSPSVSSSPDQPQTREVPSSENEATSSGFQQHSPEEKGYVLGKDGSESEATPSGFEQHSSERIGSV